MNNKWLFRSFFCSRKVITESPFSHVVIHCFFLENKGLRSKTASFFFLTVNLHMNGVWILGWKSLK